MFGLDASGPQRVDGPPQRVGEGWVLGLELGGGSLQRVAQPRFVVLVRIELALHRRHQGPELVAVLVAIADTVDGGIELVEQLLQRGFHERQGTLIASQ